MSKGKQICRVYDAACDGANTSMDVSDVTGLPLGVASAYVSKLIRMGLLRRTGRAMHTGARGRRAKCFEVL